MRLKGIRPSKNYEDRRQPYSTLYKNIQDQMRGEAATKRGKVFPDDGSDPNSFQSDKVSRLDKIREPEPVSNYLQKTDYNNGKTDRLPERKTYGTVNDALKNMGAFKKAGKRK